MLLVLSQLKSGSSSFTGVRRTSSFIDGCLDMWSGHAPPKLKLEINEDNSHYFLWERMSVCTLFVLLKGFI